QLVHCTRAGRIDAAALATLVRRSVHISPPIDGEAGIGLAAVRTIALGAKAIDDRFRPRTLCDAGGQLRYHAFTQWIGIMVAAIFGRAINVPSQIHDKALVRGITIGAMGLGAEAVEDCLSPGVARFCRR